ncbi:hypothetical protein E2C01_091100 [Portunus trituberculatus]|uniref:Uncharacterized protein n=1 Tax=Portunus trituberculatus TaxID=210409 RepID=A0A5B7JD42_PORTR|nr:hypothetical protein [Portunus trituberculatus]
MKANKSEGKSRIYFPHRDSSSRKPPTPSPPSPPTQPPPPPSQPSSSSLPIRGHPFIAAKHGITTEPPALTDHLPEPQVI